MTTFVSIFLIFIVLLSMSIVSSEYPLSGILQDIDTHLGKITIRLIGDITRDKTPVICLPGINAALVDEWVRVAEHLSRHDHVVAIINFHSNSRTAPSSGIQSEDISRIINEAVLQGVFHAEKGIIMGKSWGGHAAFAYTTNHPESVIKLVLVAPAYSNAPRVAALHQTGVHTFLAWTKDDPMIKYPTSEVWIENMGSDLVFYTAEKGGHTILDEYADPILHFLNT